MTYQQSAGRAKRPTTRQLFLTEPHGEHEVLHVLHNGEGAESPALTNNSLIKVKVVTSKSSKVGNELVFTGEELTSLSRQWLKFIGDPLLKKS
jgi:hypothetical protein